MPHASLFTDRVTRLSRRLAWPLAFSLTLHGAAFLGWHSPVFYASIGHHPDAIHARLTPAPRPASAPPLAPEEPSRDPEKAEPPEKPQPAPVAPHAEPASPPAEPPPPQADPSAYPPSGALDAPAVPIGAIEPDYPHDPDDPQTQQLEGRVVLRVLINEHGAVDRVIVEDAGLLPGLFGDSAAVAFLAARFHPALRAGVPVKSQIRVEVRYGPAQ